FAEDGTALARRQPGPERLAEPAVLDRVTERRHALLRRNDAHRTETSALRDVNRRDRLRMRSSRAPYAEPGQHALRPVRERRDPRIETRLLELHRIARLDEHDAQRRSSERGGERRADETAADDQHVAVEPIRCGGALRAVAHAAALPSALPTSRSICSA